MRDILDRPAPALRITVVGAGAIGGLLAAALAHAGHDVSVLARGKTLAAIRAHGLRIEHNGQPGLAVPVHASDAAAELGHQDFVVVALKAQVLPTVAASLRPLIGGSTSVVSATNGLPWWFLDGQQREGAARIEAVDPGGIVSDALPGSRAIGCVVHLSASTREPGVIRRASGNRLIVGAAREAHAERARTLADALRAGAFDVEVTTDIRTQIWAKLWGNMNMNPLSALTGSTVDCLLDDPLTRALALSMMEEAATIGHRIGVSSGMTAEARIAVTRQLGAVKTSMLQDLEAGRELEIDPILGVFPELGRKLGVATPYCDAVLGLLRQRAATRHGH